MGYGWLRSLTNPPPKNKNKARQKLTKATNSALWRANKSTQYDEELSCVGKTPELQERTVEISGVLAWDYSYPLSYHLELEVLPRWGKLWRQELLSFLQTRLTRFGEMAKVVCGSGILEAIEPRKVKSTSLRL